MRRLRPRPPLAIAPMSVSQLTSLPICGLDGRRYLEVVRDHADELRPARVGRLVIVELDALRAVLREMTSDEPVSIDDTATNEESADEQPTSVDDVLRAIGRRRTA